MIEIKHRLTQNILFACELSTMKEALQKAVESGADLFGANLCGANLCGANLCGANLCGANLEGEVLSKTPLQLNGLLWHVLISDKYMRIGCQRFTHQEWEAFSDEQIEKMENRALEFWNQWKTPLLAVCKQHKEDS